jgi:CO/xanthine dehydrogenase Mo-binding subunit
MMNPMRMRPRDASLPAAMSRRMFLKSTAAAGAGLSLGLYFGDALSQMSGPGKTVGGAAAGTFEPNAFLRIGKDNTVTVVVKHLEMGQGVYTGLPTLIAEELDASWSQVRVEGAPADAKRYNNLQWGEAQGTGGSTAIANSFDQYRQAGAAARAMLIAAAAQQWKVPAESVQVKSGVVSHASGSTCTLPISLSLASFGREVSTMYCCSGSTPNTYFTSKSAILPSWPSVLKKYLPSRSNIRDSRP